MNIYLSVDMEGINGISSSSEVLPKGLDYDRSRKLMAEEVNTVVEGALAGGAKRIVVNDAHNTMTNIRIEDLHPKAELVSGLFKPLSMMEGIDEGFDAVFLVGYHAGAGVSKGVLGHTFVPTNTFRKVEINNITVNEAYLTGALAGFFDVPVKLLLGDKWAVEQSREFFPNAKFVSVKEGRGMFSALYYPYEKTKEEIYKAAQEAVSLQVSPLKVKKPVTVAIEMATPVMVDVALLIANVIRVKDLKIEFTCEDYFSAFKQFMAISSLAGRAKDEVY